MPSVNQRPISRWAVSTCTRFQGYGFHGSTRHGTTPLSPHPPDGFYRGANCCPMKLEADLALGGVRLLEGPGCTDGINKYSLKLTPHTLHPVPYTLYPTPYSLLPTPYSLPHTGGRSRAGRCPPARWSRVQGWHHQLLPAPYNSHPPSYTRHIIPYTLHPTPYSLPHTPHPTRGTDLALGGVPTARWFRVLVLKESGGKVLPL